MSEEQAGGFSNPQFEQMVLGAALNDIESWETISRKLVADDFYTPAHRDLFTGLVHADEAGHRDPALIAQALVDGGTPDGYEVIANATTNPAPRATLPKYIESLKSHSRARAAAKLGYSLQRDIADSSGDPSALLGILAQHDEDMRALTEDIAEEPWVRADQVMAEVERGDTRLQAHMPTGFVDLDKQLQGGFRPGQMVVFAGRPAMGKTTIVLDMCRNASLHHDIPGLFVSLEMSQAEIGTKLAAAECAIPMKDFVEDALTDAQHEQVRRTIEDIDESPLLIMASEGSWLMASEGSWPAIRSAITTAHRRYGIKYAAIDYLQLVTVKMRSRNATRQDEVATLSRNIKLLASQLGITIFAVSQLNRGAESRSGNIPQMSDLRESGSIEQDADIIGLLHRPDYYDPNHERAGEGDVIIAKHRNGPTGTVRLAFQGHYSRFASRAPSYATDPTDPYPAP